MYQSQQIPENPKKEPGAGKCGRKQEELVAPLHVQKCCPEVPHVEGAPPTDMVNANVAAAIFRQDASPLPQSPNAT